MNTNKCVFSDVLGALMRSLIFNAKHAVLNIMNALKKCNMTHVVLILPAWKSRSQQLSPDASDFDCTAVVFQFGLNLDTNHKITDAANMCWQPLELSK